MKDKKIKVGVLFSGGKDSSLALHYALKYTDVKCLISIISKNPESYMFHTPNIKLVGKQAEAIGLPIIMEKTKGEKEIELRDLERAIKKAAKLYRIEGIVTGAIESIYQASRIQRICNKLGIECFNPLWQRNQFELLEEILKLKFDVIIAGVFAEGMGEFLGKKIDAEFVSRIRKMHEQYKINPAGEGGEFESLVLDAPFFKKGMRILKSQVKEDKHRGRILEIDETDLIKKEKNEK